MMIYSMTGFADSQEIHYGWRFVVELKAVNHRYLNITCKIPEELRFLEAKLAAVIAAYITRGKVECHLACYPLTAVKTIVINETVSSQLLNLNKKFTGDGLSSLTVADLLKFPGALVDQTFNWQQFTDPVISQLRLTITEFNNTRAREGERLQAHLNARLDKIKAVTDMITADYPAKISQTTERLTAKLKALLGEHLETERLNQELALYIQKIDVDEELSRLQAHISEVKSILAAAAPQTVGKRLDFMMQEFNREVNTMASKANNLELTRATIELKVLIEQMREQIQNIE